MDNYSLDDFLPGDKPIQPDTGPDDSQISTDVLPYDMQAVNDLTASILDSALHGVDQESINQLYLVLQDIAAYQTIDAVQGSVDGLQGVTLSPAMFVYLYLIDCDLSPLVACKAIKLSKSQPIIWKKENKLFSAVLDAIKAGQAEELESVVWQNARFNPAAERERMFALKARKPEYRDNAPTPTPGNVSVRITLNNTPIDISENYRQTIDVTPEEEEE